MPSAALSYFLRSNRDVVLLETIEITHSSFTQDYRIVRNHPLNGGVDVTLETGGDPVHFQYYPLQITHLAGEPDLDTGIRVDLGDLGEILPKEMDAVFADDTMSEKPKVVYRAYRSDDLDAPMVGPLFLEATTLSFNNIGASFEASAPYVNITKTGQVYNLTRFFTLRGFMK